MTLDYTEQLKIFLMDHFSPGTVGDYDFHYTNNSFLDKLHLVFPVNAISDYQLTEILTELGYTRTILKSNCLILNFSKKLIEAIGEDQLEEKDILTELHLLTEKFTFQENYFCWLLKNK